MTNPMHEARAALALHPKCGAYCRTTENPCRNPAMKNGRCRMHGGKSSGRPVIHGRATRLRKQTYIKAQEILGILKSTIKDFTS